MTNVFNFVTRYCGQYEYPRYSRVTSFLYDPTVTPDPAKAMKAAVDEFMADPTGKAAVEEHINDSYKKCFDWGDVLLVIPEKWFADRGLTKVPSASFEVLEDKVLVGTPSEGFGPDDDDDLFDEEDDFDDEED